MRTLVTIPVMYIFVCFILYFNTIITGILLIQTYNVGVLVINYKSSVCTLFAVGVQCLSTATPLFSPRKTVKDKTGKNIVFVDGVRTPFLMSGTEYSNLMAHELAKHALL